MKESETVETIRQRQWLIGKWDGHAAAVGGGTLSWTMQRFDDGMFRIDFRPDGLAAMPEPQSEVGVWGVSGGIYFTATRGFVHHRSVVPAVTNDAALYDTYRIVALSRDSFEYENLSTGNRYVTKRVRGTSETSDASASD